MIMPIQSVFMIRLSLLWLLLTTIIGALLLINKVNVIHPVIWALLPVHFEIAIWGWVIQCVIGTAYWIFPRHMNDQPRGSERAANWMVILFNLGLVLLIFGYLHRTSQVLQLVGRSAIIIAILIFALMIWNRSITYLKR